MNQEGKGVSVTAYTTTDPAELVEYHLVGSAADDT